MSGLFNLDRLRIFFLIEKVNSFTQSKVRICYQFNTSETGLLTQVNEQYIACISLINLKNIDHLLC